MLRGLSAAFCALAIIAGGFFATESAKAANPSSGNLNATGPSLPWQGTGTGTGAANGEADCALPSAPCDGFTLRLNGTLEDFANKQVRIRIDWALPGTDYDMYVHRNNIGGQIVSQSAAANTTNTFEEIIINPASVGMGPFFVNTVYYAGQGGGQNQYSGIVSIESLAAPGVVPPSTCSTNLNYTPYQPPLFNPASTSTVENPQLRAGEPSIGVNWNTGNVMFMANLRVLRASFNDTMSPAAATWAKTNDPLTLTANTLDPIMFTDSVTGRTLPGQLSGGQSAAAITDDDGQTYTPTLLGAVGAGVDHQTVGGGPFKPGIVGRQPLTSYPHAVYYASQDIGFANFSISLDGGQSFPTALQTNMYSLVQCGGLHGHISVAPDGTVYVPNKNCSGVGRGGQAVVVSEDNGANFEVRVIPNSGSGDNDPSVGIGAAGRLYFAYTAGDKTIHVAISDDKGKNWRDDQNIGKGVEIAPGIIGDVKASVFPRAIAGDNDRAAVFFLGTGSTDPDDPTGTDGEDGTAGNTADDFAGTWYPYIATTCNGGKSWSVVRADDPVQQGVVCTNGTTCPAGTRNLLDFNGLTVDRQGRVLAGFADGCFTGPCEARTSGNFTRLNNDGGRYATVLRQRSGSRLFAAFDPAGPSAPIASPGVDVEVIDKNAVGLKWQTPDDNGSEIVKYRIYRGDGYSRDALVAEVGANVLEYRDRARAKSGNYYYVTAVNAFGESPRNLKFYPTQAGQ